MLRTALLLLLSVGGLLIAGCGQRVQPGPTSDAAVNLALRAVVHELFCAGDSVQMQRDVSPVLGGGGKPTCTLVFTDNFITVPDRGWQLREGWRRSNRAYEIAQAWYAPTADTTGLRQRLRNIRPLALNVDSGASLNTCNGLVLVDLRHTAFKKADYDARYERWPGPVLFITLSQPILLGQPGLVAYYYELARNGDRWANSGHYCVVDTKRQRVLASHMLFIH